MCCHNKISDHYPIYCAIKSINNNKPTSAFNKYSFRNTKNIDGNNFRNDLETALAPLPFNLMSTSVSQKTLDEHFNELLSARLRRLAGHLFQNRWKDQGRGFILLPPWPPNCLGQMLTVRDFSQHLVSSSKTIRPNIPRCARCMGHCEMM